MRAPTYVAVLTPPGAAAIATLALRGPEGWAIARELFRPLTPTGAGLPDQPQPGRFRLGRFGDDLRDEVVLAVRRATPVAWLEIHAHGGIEVVRLLTEAIVARGAVLCSWDVFERHASDAAHAEAAHALAHALTVRTAAILLDQWHGAFARALAGIVEALEAGSLAEALHDLELLTARIPIGRHLTTPWNVAVLGAPNVGKSSLVNALAGFARCIVSGTPGTTRDVVTTRIALEGWPLELSDTAGLRTAPDALEAEGIRRAHAAAADADLVLWLLDASEPGSEPDPSLRNVLVVLNKIDLRPNRENAGEAIAVSATTGAGLPALCDAIVRRLVPEAPPSGAAVPFTAGQWEAVATARAACRENDPATALRSLREILNDER